MKFVFHDNTWGGWSASFRRSFLTRGFEPCNLAHDALYDAKRIDEPLMFFQHWNAAQTKLLRRPRTAPVGAYVHCLTDFPFTVGFRPRGPGEVEALRRFDHLFVALDCYADHMVAGGVPSEKVHVVGYPMEWEEVAAESTFPKHENTGCIASRLDPDNHPFIAAQILHESCLESPAYFSTNGMLTNPFTQAAAELGFSRLAPETRRRFLRMMSQSEWLVSATAGESFGCLYMEAEALGVKVCAPRSPGLTELYEESSLYPQYHIPNAVRRINDGEPARLRSHVRIRHSADSVVAHIRSILEA